MLILVNGFAQWEERTLCLKGLLDHPKDKTPTSLRFILQSAIIKSTAGLWAWEVCGSDELWTTLGYQVPGLKGIGNKSYLKFQFHCLLCFGSTMRVLNQRKIFFFFFFFSWGKVQFMACVTGRWGWHSVVRSRTFSEFLQRWCSTQASGEDNSQITAWEAIPGLGPLMGNMKKGIEDMVSGFSPGREMLTRQIFRISYLFFGLPGTFPVLRGTHKMREQWKTWRIQEDLH